MPKPNYAFEKRQRELAKKQKKEEKAREKAERKTHPMPGTGMPAEDDGAERPPEPGSNTSGSGGGAA